MLKVKNSYVKKNFLKKDSIMGLVFYAYFTVKCKVWSWSDVCFVFCKFVSLECGIKKMNVGLYYWVRLNNNNPTHFESNCIYAVTLRVNLKFRFLTRVSALIITHNVGGGIFYFSYFFLLLIIFSYYIYLLGVGVKTCRSAVQ